MLQTTKVFGIKESTQLASALTLSGYLTPPSPLPPLLSFSLFFALFSLPLSQVITIYLLIKMRKNLPSQLFDILTHLTISSRNYERFCIGGYRGVATSRVVSACSWFWPQRWSKSSLEGSFYSMSHYSVELLWWNGFRVFKLEYLQAFKIYFFKAFIVSVTVLNGKNLRKVSRCHVPLLPVINWHLSRLLSLLAFCLVNGKNLAPWFHMKHPFTTLLFRFLSSFFAVMCSCALRYKKRCQLLVHSGEA